MEADRSMTRAIPYPFVDIHRGVRVFFCTHNDVVGLSATNVGVIMASGVPMNSTVASTLRRTRVRVCLYRITKPIVP